MHFNNFSTALQAQDPELSLQHLSPLYFFFLIHTTGFIFIAPNAKNVTGLWETRCPISCVTAMKEDSVIYYTIQKSISRMNFVKLLSKLSGMERKLRTALVSFLLFFPTLLLQLYCLKF